MLNDNALTTVDFIKRIGGLSNLDEDQIFIIETFINAASDIIENYCKKSFGGKTHIETYCYPKLLKLKYSPISVINYIKINGCYQNIDEFCIDYSEGIIDLSCHCGIMRLEISYDTGFILRKDETETKKKTLPDEIELAVYMFYKTFVSNEGEVISGNVKKEKFDDYEIEYGSSSKTSNNSELPDTIKLLLSPYKDKGGCCDEL